MYFGHGSQFPEKIQLILLQINYAFPDVAFNKRWVERIFPEAAHNSYYF